MRKTLHAYPDCVYEDNTVVPFELYPYDGDIYVEYLKLNNEFNKIDMSELIAEIDKATEPLTVKTMKNPVTIELDIYNACRTNTARALSNSNNHYNLSFLAHISGARFEDLIANLQWCAENKEDEIAIECIQHFAEAALSAYEIQRSTY